VRKISALKYILMLARNIIFQGVLYMTMGEKVFKIAFTIVFSVVFYLIFNNILISVLIAHLLNYIINGQFYVVYRYFDSKANMTEDSIKNYIAFIRRCITFFKPLDVLIIGGFSRGHIKCTSDLDIRIYHDNTILKSIKAYLMAATYRFYGLIVGFPIDVFCFSDLKFLDKIRKDEIPVNFLFNNDVLRKYPTSPNYKIQLNNIKYDKKN